MISKLLGISKLDDWYRVSHKDLQNCRIDTYLKRSGGLTQLLSKVYPQHEWNQDRFCNRPKKSSQWWLYNTLKAVLPSDISVVEDYVLPSIAYSKTGCPMTFDIYVPSFNVIFEYNGYQHYFDHSLFGYAKSHQDRDKERCTACNSNGIYYIEVPYWWRHDKESIIAILHRHRPDIMSDAPSIAPYEYEKNSNRHMVEEPAKKKIIIKFG